jgi:hypothetical protein
MNIEVVYFAVKMIINESVLGGCASVTLLKELNPRRRVYVEIPKPVRVELKCSQNLRQAETFSVRKNGGNQI